MPAVKAIRLAAPVFMLLGCAGPSQPEADDRAVRGRARDLLPGLALKLRGLRTDGAVLSPVIDPDPEVTVEVVVAAVDAAREAGFELIEFAAPQESWADEPPSPHPGPPVELPDSRTGVPFHRDSASPGLIELDRRARWRALSRQIGRFAMAGIRDVSLAVRVPDGRRSVLDIALPVDGCDDAPEGEFPRIFLRTGNGAKSWRVEVEVQRNTLYFPAED